MYYDTFEFTMIKCSIFQTLRSTFGTRLIVKLLSLTRYIFSLSVHRIFISPQYGVRHEAVEKAQFN